MSPFAAEPDHGYLAGRLRQVLDASREAVMSSTDPIPRYLLTLRGIEPRTESRPLPMRWRMRGATRCGPGCRRPARDSGACTAAPSPR